MNGVGRPVDNAAAAAAGPASADIIHLVWSAHAPRHLLSAAARADLYFFCPDAGLAGSWPASRPGGLGPEGVLLPRRQPGPPAALSPAHSGRINLARSRLRRTPARRWTDHPLTPRSADLVSRSLTRQHCSAEPVTRCTSAPPSCNTRQLPWRLRELKVGTQRNHCRRPDRRGGQSLLSPQAQGKGR